MARSACPSCKSTRFEMCETSVAGARYRHLFIQCSSCGTVVSVMEYIYAAELLQQALNKIDDLSSRLSYIESTLNSR